MLLALFAGNLGMKTFTSPVLRRWALTLRLAGTVAGGPVLLAFHLTFATLALLMAAAAITGFRLEAGAGAAVSGHQVSGHEVRMSPAPPRAGPP